MPRRRRVADPTPYEVLAGFAHDSNHIEGAPTTGDWLNDHIAAAALADVCGLQRILIPPEAYHTLLFYRQPDFPDHGRLRTERVVIGDGIRVIYRCPPPDLVEPLIRAWSDATIELVFDGEGPFLTQWDIHHAFESIHPFRDGNGRVGRLLLNNVQRAMAGYWITVDYEERADYYAGIQQWRRLPHGLKSFLEYADVSPWDGLELPAEEVKTAQ